jgi:hypothetical protein
MDFNATIDLIIKDLQEAVKIIDDLKKYPGIPMLQVELAKAKCKSAGEVIAMLKTMDIIKPSVNVEQVDSFVEPEMTKGIEKKKTAKVVKPLPIITPEPVKTEQTHPETIHSQEVVKQEPLTTTKKEQASVTIGESFSNQQDSFNDLLSNQNSDDAVAERLKSKPITSLSEAIGVNDRFLFIRDIFNGSNDAFNQAISRLDKTESISDARAVIMSYTGDNKENEAVKQLIDLVKRKLPSNE